MTDRSTRKGTGGVVGGDAPPVLWMVDAQGRPMWNDVPQLGAIPCRADPPGGIGRCGMGVVRGQPVYPEITLTQLTKLNGGLRELVTKGATTSQGQRELWVKEGNRRLEQMDVDAVVSLDQDGYPIYTRRSGGQTVGKDGESYTAGFGGGGKGFPWGMVGLVLLGTGLVSGALWWALRRGGRPPLPAAL